MKHYSRCVTANRLNLDSFFCLSRLWYFADLDLLSGKASYRLCNTGQGLNRWAAAELPFPRSRAKKMVRNLATVRKLHTVVGTW